MPGMSPICALFRISSAPLLVAAGLLVAVLGACQSDPDQAPIRSPLGAVTTPETLPVTTITNVCGLNLIVTPGNFMKVRWTGIDPDNPTPPHLPAYYEWKLIPVVLFNALDANWIVKVHPGPLFPWIRAETSQSAVDLNLDQTQDFVFAVRAIAADGDSEDTFEYRRNALLISPSAVSPPGPILTISETGLGSFVFPTDGSSVSYDVSPRCLQFHFEGTSEARCALVEDYNYGIDVPDVNGDGPGSGFRGWSEKTFTEPLCLTSGVHVLTVKARDDMGGITIGTIYLNVTDVARDRDVLYVDDFRQASSQGVTDAFMDQYVRDMLLDTGYLESQIDQFDTFGPGDLQAEPNLPTLALLSHYKLVVWSVNGTGFNGNPALIYLSACSENGYVLREYLQSGGGLWIFGQRVFGAMKRYDGEGICRAELNYDETTGLAFDSAEFPCQVLSICAGDIRDARNNPQVNGLERGTPTPAVLADLFPRVEIDSTVFTLAASGYGIPFVDVDFQPDQVPGLQALYTEDANGPSSSFNGKPVAFRYFNPVASPGQGPVAVFGFPLHLLKPGSAAARTGTHGLALALIDWFRSHEVPPPGISAELKGGTP